MFPERKRGRERKRERTCVDIYVRVFRALTLANDLLDKALMKLGIATFDISLPSQHLVFVFDAPKWLLMRPASVPALWNEEMLRRCCCCSPVRNLESSSFSCSHFLPPLAARTGAISLVTRRAPARRCRHACAVAAGQTYLASCAHLRGDLYPLKLLSISRRSTRICERDAFRHCGVTDR